MKTWADNKNEKPDYEEAIERAVKLADNALLYVHRIYDIPEVNEAVRQMAQLKTLKKDKNGDPKH